MKFIVKGRDEGKTISLLKMCGVGDVLVVKDADDVRSVKESAQQRGLVISDPITFEAFKNGRYPKNIDALLIDNVDVLIRQLSPGIPILAVTATHDGSAVERFLSWIQMYVKEEGFSERHFQAIEHIVGLFNDCQESEEEIFGFADELFQKYAG